MGTHHFTSLGGPSSEEKTSERVEEILYCSGLEEGETDRSKDPLSIRGLGHGKRWISTTAFVNFGPWSVSSLRSVVVLSATRMNGT